VVSLNLAHPVEGLKFDRQFYLHHPHLTPPVLGAPIRISAWNLLSKN